MGKAVAQRHPRIGFGKSSVSMNFNLCREIKNAAMQPPGIREAEMASAKFLRRQADRCADLARRTHDEESRERCEQLRVTYCHLAEMEEQQAGDLNASSGDSERRSAA